MLADFVDAVAALHRLDPSSLDLPGFDIPRTPEDHARLDLQRWRAIAETAALDLDPLARYAGGYLLAHPPGTVARTCLVQGDTGPGNFVVADGRVTGLVDMEFAHVGDPMDDVAWILMRGIGDDPGPYLARYTERSGIAIDAASVAYYAVAVRYRCVITTTLAAARGGGARGWAPYLMATERFLRETAATLSDCLGVHEPTSRPARGAADGTHRLVRRAPRRPARRRARHRRSRAARTHPQPPDPRALPAGPRPHADASSTSVTARTPPRVGSIRATTVRSRRPAPPPTSTCCGTSCGGPSAAAHSGRRSSIASCASTCGLQPHVASCR